MLDPAHLFKIFLAAAFVNNYVLMMFLGLCPYFGVSKKVETGVGMGFAVLFVMTLASVGSWLSWNLLLKPGQWNLISLATGQDVDLTFLQTVVFILIIAVLVQLTEMFLKKANPTLYEALGVYLPLITTNCAILGVALINIKNEYNLIECIAESFGAALGFGIALVLMGGIRERLDVTHVPKAFQGPPIAFCTAALMALSFMGFSGML
jgi:electron transport complex protein RnfA